MDGLIFLSKFKAYVPIILKVSCSLSLPNPQLIMTQEVVVVVSQLTFGAGKSSCMGYDLFTKLPLWGCCVVSFDLYKQDNFLTSYERFGHLGGPVDGNVGCGKPVQWLWVCPTSYTT